MSPDNPLKFTALIPAGGTGSRMGGSIPKQFLMIADKPMLAWTILALLACPWIRRIDVVVSAHAHEADLAGVLTAVGDAAGEAADRVRFIAAAGATRRDTVLGGLEHSSEIERDTWVMVHDAARPGLPPPVLQRLRHAIAAGAGGALAATPVADTVKRSAASAGPARVTSTVPRTGLWLAQTPQVFRADELREALRRYPDVTDESSAMELAGCVPELVLGDWQNLKVTTPADLKLMERILAFP